MELSKYKGTGVQTETLYFHSVLPSGDVTLMKQIVLHIVVYIPSTI